MALRQDPAFEVPPLGATLVYLGEADGVDERVVWAPVRLLTWTPDRLRTVWVVSLENQSLADGQYGSAQPVAGLAEARMIHELADSGRPASAEERRRLLLMFGISLTGRTVS